MIEKIKTVIYLTIAIPVILILIIFVVIYYIGLYLAYLLAEPKITLDKIKDILYNKVIKNLKMKYGK